jgi:hypothetical protein
VRILLLRLCGLNKSYRNDQQDAAVYDSLLFHCSLTAQHVSGDIIAHHQELLNCNYSFWFYLRFSLPAAVMAEWELCNYSLEAPDDER